VSVTCKGKLYLWRLCITACKGKLYLWHLCVTASGIKSDASTSAPLLKEMYEEFLNLCFYTGSLSFKNMRSASFGLVQTDVINQKRSYFSWLAYHVQQRTRIRDRPERHRSWYCRSVSIPNSTKGAASSHPQRRLLCLSVHHGDHCSRLGHSTRLFVRDTRDNSWLVTHMFILAAVCHTVHDQYPRPTVASTKASHANKEKGK
jgi:hypothetical protein